MPRFLSRGALTTSSCKSKPSEEYLGPSFLFLFFWCTSTKKKPVFVLLNISHVGCPAPFSLLVQNDLTSAVSSFFFFFSSLLFKKRKQTQKKNKNNNKPSCCFIIFAEKKVVALIHGVCFHGDRVSCRSIKRPS